MIPRFYFVLLSAVLGLGLAIPSNICIVIVNLKSLRKKGKLSPSDGIFMAKAIVNLLLQTLLILQGIPLVSPPSASAIQELYSSVLLSSYFLTYYSFWLTAWLSVHYCTSITNLSHGLFIWMKGIVSNFLSRILFLTALGVVVMTAPGVWALNAIYDSNAHSSQNSTQSFGTVVTHSLYRSYFVPVTFLGCILPFCLSLLCLLLTFSFLVRHVWRVKNTNVGPNIQAVFTALRTILFLLLICTASSFSLVLFVIRHSSKFRDLINVICFTLQTMFPSVEAAVIFQASNKLRRVIQRRFWTTSWRHSET